MSKLPVTEGLEAQSVLHITSIREIQSPTIEHKRLPASNVVAGLPAQIIDEDGMCNSVSPGSDNEDVQSLDDDIDKSVSLSSLAWEAYELSSDWSKSLKGDHGILAALDLSLPLPMCNVDLSSPTKPRDILDIFGDVMDLPPLNNFMEGRTDSTDNNVDRCGTSADVDVINRTSNISSTSALCVNIAGRGSGALDRSNTLMTPQELERMPDQGLEFEQSVGPKQSPQEKPHSPTISEPSQQATENGSSLLCAGDAPVVLSENGDERTLITVLTSMGRKSFQVNTEQLRQAAALMQPVIINSEGESCSFTLVMMPVSKMKILPSTDSQRRSSFAKFKCLHCDRTFERSYKLRIHEMMKHTLEKPYKCSQPGCKWAFSDAYRLRNHEQCHLKVKNHTCELCGKSYTSVWNLQSHIAQIHDADKQFYKCEYCEQTFTAETKLYKHISISHPEQPKRFVCDEEGCETRFHSKLGLMRHMVGHKKRKEMNLTCPVEGCGRTFNWKSRLDIHVKSHTGELGYKCPYQGCTAAFVNTSVLNRHLKIHSADKRFTCSICLKTFHRPDHLKNHEQSHSTTRPFQCPQLGCRYASTTKRAMESHLKRHAIKANRAVLVCPDQECDFTFSTMPQLLKHINAHHPHIMEVRYAKELAETNLDMQSEDKSHQKETLLATRSVTEDSSMDWSLQDIISTDQCNETMTVINTEVAGKSIELILPAPSEERTTSPAAMSYVRPTKRKLEKGSARTDSLVNNRVCAKARERQQKQKEESFVSLDTRTTSVEPEAEVNAVQFVVGEVCDREGDVSSENITSNLHTFQSSIPSGLQWYSPTQEGADDIYTVTNSQLDQLSEQVEEDNSFSQLYDLTSLEG